MRKIFEDCSETELEAAATLGGGFAIIGLLLLLFPQDKDGGEKKRSLWSTLWRAFLFHLT